MKFDKKQSTPLLSLILFTLLAISIPLESMAAGSGNLSGFSGFTGADLFSKAVFEYTGTSTTGGATVAVSNDVPTITMTAKGYKAECGNHFSECTTTVTLTAEETISFNCVFGGNTTASVVATQVETVDGTTKITANANSIVTFTIHNDTINEKSGTVTISNVKKVTSKVPADSASFSYNGQAFPYLDEAIDAASTNGGTIVVATSGTVYDSSVEDAKSLGDYLAETHSFTIPAGVTLLVPHDAINTTYYDTPTFKDCVWGSTLPSVPYAIPTDYRVLTLAKGTNLIVDGSLCVSGQPMGYGSGGDTPNGGITGPAGRLQLNGNSTVTVNGGLYSYGFITGDGSIDVISGAEAYEMFTFTDWRGGKISSAIKTANKSNKLFMFSQYYIQNIEAKMTVNSGASLYAWTGIGYGNSGSSDVKTSKIAIIGDSTASMFKLDNGSITKRYIPATDRLQLDVNGDASMGNISITDKDAGTVSSADFYLPINSNWTINVNSGNVSSTQKLALLPGVEFNIAQGANVELGADMVVFDLDNWGNYCATWGQLKPINSRPGGLKYTRTAGSSGSYTFADPQDAKIKINGTLTAETGKLYTTAAGANIYSTSTGKIVTTVGTTTSVNQANANCSSYSAKFDTIEITSAKLKNGDGTYSQYGSGTYLYKPASGTWACETHAGMDDSVCDTCGYTSHDTHTFGEYISNGDATLYEDGTKTRWCTYKNCMEHETVVDEGSMLIPAAVIVESGAKYLTLAEAVDAAQTDDRVLVKKNLTLDATQKIPLDKNFTLDLDAYTITCGGTVISNEGTLSITGNGGKIINTASGAAIYNTATIGSISGNVTIESAGIGIQVTGANATIGTIGDEGSVISVISSSNSLYLSSGAKVTTIAAPNGSVTIQCTTAGPSVVYLHSSEIGLLGENVFIRGNGTAFSVSDDATNISTKSTVGEINAGNGRIEIIASANAYALSVGKLSYVGPIRGNVLFVGPEVSGGCWIVIGKSQNIGPFYGGYFYKYGGGPQSIFWLDDTYGHDLVQYGECKGLSSSTTTVQASNGNTYTCYYVTDVHDYEAAVTAPTCTERGYTTYACSCGGNYYVDDYVDATGHHYVLQEGKMVCKYCGTTHSSSGGGSEDPSNGAEVAHIIGKRAYATLQDAVNAWITGDCIQLLTDSDKKTEIDKAVLIDLSGFDVSNVEIAEPGVVFMDSTTNGYTAAGGTLTVTDGEEYISLVTSYDIDGVPKEGEDTMIPPKHYVKVLNDDKSYSFRRVGIGVTGMQYIVDGTNKYLVFQAKFRGPTDQTKSQTNPADIGFMFNGASSWHNRDSESSTTFSDGSVASYGVKIPADAETLTIRALLGYGTYDSEDETYAGVAASKLISNILNLLKDESSS